MSAFSEKPWGTMKGSVGARRGPESVFSNF
jgi:hypothetical protein